MIEVFKCLGRNTETHTTHTSDLENGILNSQEADLDAGEKDQHVCPEFVHVCPVFRIK